MANEIIVKSTKRGNVVLPEFEKEGKDVLSIAEEPRRIKIFSKKVKNKQTKQLFTAVSGYAKLPCYDIDGNYEGIKVKSLNVHFQKDAFKNAVNVKSPDDLKYGNLYVKAKGLQIPSKYQPTYQKDEDGDDVYDEKGNAVIEYPVIWIKDECVIGFEEFVTSQDALDVDSDSNVADAEIVSSEDAYDEETGELLDEDIKQYQEDDTNDTEETEI